MIFTEEFGWNNVAVGTISTAYRRKVKDSCDSFRDPHEDVRADLNKMMVWAGMLSAAQPEPYHSTLESRIDPAAAMNSTVTGYKTGTHAVYMTDFEYFAAAAIVVMACIATIAPAYWGWWTLGRSVSFSPLEIAKVNSIHVNHNRIVEPYADYKEGLRITSARFEQFELVGS